MRQRASADRVVVCVFDGLRPDMVTPELTPNLLRLARRGLWFREARSVFPSMTRVATTSIATGAPPSVHGIVGNAFYMPAAARTHVLDTGRADDLALAEEAADGDLVGAATFGDQLAAAGRSLAVVHTGSAGSAYLINPRAVANRHWTYSILGREHSQTPHAVDEVVARFGPPPRRSLPRFEEIDYAETVLTQHVLERLRPDVALVWFNEPDTSYHYRFLGSPETLSVLAHVDAAFGRILDWVEAQADAERYAVIAASDHGQISTSAQVDLPGLLSGQGHTAYAAAERRLDGARIALTGGNMGGIWIIDGGSSRRDAIARWMAEQPFTGLLFSAPHNDIEGEVPGTFSHALVQLDHPRAPDLTFVLRSSEEPDPWGRPGLGLLTGGVPVGGGMHGGLNRHELNTLLMVSARGMEPGLCTAPAGIVDIAPTILDLLDVQAPTTMRGRSLAEAPPDAAPRTVEVGVDGRRQLLSFADLGGRRILLSGSTSSHP